MSRCLMPIDLLPRPIAELKNELHTGPLAPVHRAWLLRVAGGAAALAVVVSAAVAVLSLRRTPRPTPDPPPRPAGAFAHGGRPHRGDATLERALTRDLPDFLVALDRWRRARNRGGLPSAEPALRWAALEDLRDRLEAPALRRALGGAGSAWLSLLVRFAPALVTTRRVEPLVAPYVQVVRALNGALAARGLGYYLDSELLYNATTERYVLLQVFRVVRVQRYRAEGRTYGALHLRRIDRLNWSHGALGFTRPEHRGAMVLLDAVDDILVTLLLPALSANRLNLADAAATQAGARWADTVARHAGRAVGRELGHLPGLDRRAATTLATLLAKRQTLIRTWQRQLAHHGYRMAPPTSLTFDWDYRAALRRVVASDQLETMARLEAQLKRPRMRQTLAVLRRIVARSVAHHELQHKLDDTWLVRRGLPETLRQGFGPLRWRGRLRPRVRKAVSELSAYLAELARSRHWAQLDLALIARFVFDARYAGSAEQQAARRILSGLARLTGVPPQIARAAQNRRQLARLYVHLSEQPSSYLTGAARYLWEAFFGTALPRLGRAAPDADRPCATPQSALGWPMEKRNSMRRLAALPAAVSDRCRGLDTP